MHKVSELQERGSEETTIHLTHIQVFDSCSLEGKLWEQ